MSLLSRGRRCGGDLWRARPYLSPARFIRGEACQSEQVAKQVASARHESGRRCGGDLWRDRPYLGPARFIRGEACQSEQVAKQVASAKG